MKPLLCLSSSEEIWVAAEPCLSSCFRKLPKLLLLNHTFNLQTQGSYHIWYEQDQDSMTGDVSRSLIFPCVRANTPLILQVIVAEC